MTYFNNILKAYTRTHMPYVSVHGNDILYLFCVLINGVWKIHYVLNDGPCTRLNTGQADDTNECSPVGCYVNGTGWQVSFIAGASASHMQLTLYKTMLATGDTVRIRKAKVGFYINDKQLAFGDFSGSFYFHNLTSPTGCRVKNAVELLSLRPRADGTFFLSYRDMEDTIVSVWLSPYYQTALWLHDHAGNSLYKMCEWDKGVYYALRDGADFEDRRVVFTTSPVKTELSFADNFELFTVRGSLEETTRRHALSDILYSLPEELR